MNSNSNTTILMIENIDDESISIDDDIHEFNYNQQSRTHITRSSVGSTSSNCTIINGTKRPKTLSPCYVCGAKAHGYNFDQITCESCKAFFRRNALKSMDKFRCRNNDNCIITSTTRKRCKRCRLTKCFKVGMRKEWILTDEEKSLKREKIVRNRMIKQQAQLIVEHSTNDLIEVTSSQIKQSHIIPSPLIHMYHSPNQQMYERQEYLLKQLSNGYHLITKQYPQPNKFIYRNLIISQTENFDLKLLLIKDLTRELTQMTTLRLLNFFNLIPEFQLLTQQEKQSILIQNMLTVFMFHGALTYNANNDTFVDRTTTDQPYDAKYLLFVYGPRVYHNFIALARELTLATYQSTDDKETDRHAHTLFLLLMIILLFSNAFQVNSIEDKQSKLNKIQQNYIDIACRFLHDHFGFIIRRRIFKKLAPLLIDLQKLCSTLANVNLCEKLEDEDRTSSRIITTNYSEQQSIQSLPISSSTEFNSTMISGRSHLNELQKENRAPSPSNSTSLSPTFHNYQI